MYGVSDFRKRLIAVATTALFANLANAQVTESKPLLRTHALLINVHDMQKAVDFYVGKLGFEAEENGRSEAYVRLKTPDRIRLILNKVEKVEKHEPTDPQVGLTLQVNDLEKSMARLSAAGMKMDPAGPRKEGVGNAIYIYDPFGRRISLMHQTIVKVPEFKEPRIYNFGVLVPDMDAARDFYVTKLGFVVRSEKYLPKDLPLGHSDNTFSFMVHYREGVRPVAGRDPGISAAYTIVFETDDLAEVKRVFSEARIMADGKIPTGNGFIFRDPFGIVLHVIDINAAAASR